MIIMTEKLQNLMDELKVTNAETFYHALSVKKLALKLMKQLNCDGVTNYSPDEINAILKGAILHDIGKLYVKNVILTKDSGLTREEKETITEHTWRGFEAVESELTEEEYDIVRNICMYHHERIDGQGYVGKSDLPLYVQIVSLCDAYDALHSHRVYRDALPHDEVISIIESGKCGAFDSVLVEYLKQVTEKQED